MRDYKTLSRIAALLRQAEGTDNEHEAQAFMVAAQRIATAAAIDLAVARLHSPAVKSMSPTVRQIIIGKGGKRGLRTYVQLFVAVARANEVTVDVSYNSTFVLAYGFDTDIDTTEALYTSLLIQMVTASDAYLKSGAYKGERAARLSRQGKGWPLRHSIEYSSLSPITARLNFQAAFAERIGLRLSEACEDVRVEVVAPEAKNGFTSTALALRNKELEVATFYASRSTANGSWRATRAGDRYSEAARRAGDSAGRRARFGEQGCFEAPRGAIEKCGE